VRSKGKLTLLSESLKLLFLPGFKPPIPLWEDGGERSCWGVAGSALLVRRGLGVRSFFPNSCLFDMVELAEWRRCSVSCELPYCCMVRSLK